MNLRENYRDYFNYENLTKEREKYLFSNLDDESCREEIIKSHLKLVIDISSKYKFVEPAFFEDLIQEGTIGLIEAVNKFDLSLGFRFSTYASFLIKNKIRSSIRKNVFPFYVPEKKIHQIFKVYKTIKDQQTVNVSVGIDKIRAQTGYNEEQIIDLFSITNLFLNKNQDELNKINLEKIDSSIKIKKILNIIQYLDKIDRNIIKLRYYKDKTWREISIIVGMSHEGCRKRHNRIINILKNNIKYTDTSVQKKEG